MPLSPPRSLTLAGAFVVAAAAGSCSARQPLPTYAVPAGTSFTAGELVIGTMMTVEGSPCVHVKMLGQAPVALLWPPGFTAGANPLRVYDPQGVEIAAEGDTVTAGGSWTDKWSVDCGTQGYFEVLDFNRGEPTFAN